MFGKNLLEYTNITLQTKFFYDHFPESDEMKKLGCHCFTHTIKHYLSYSINNTELISLKRKPYSLQIMTSIIFN